MSSSRWWLRPAETATSLWDGRYRIDLVFDYDDGTVWSFALRGIPPGPLGPAQVIWDHRSAVLVMADQRISSDLRDLLRDLFRTMAGPCEGWSLTPVEQSVLDAVATGLRAGQWTTGKKLRSLLKMDRTAFELASKRLIPRYLQEDRNHTGDFFTLTFPGLLESRDGETARKVVESALAVHNRQFGVDPDFKEYKIDDVLKEGGFASDLAEFVRNIIVVAWLQQGGGGGTCTVPPDNEDLVECTTIDDFLRRVRRGHDYVASPTCPRIPQTESFAAPGLRAAIDGIPSHPEPQTATQPAAHGVRVATGTQPLPPQRADAIDASTAAAPQPPPGDAMSVASARLGTLLKGKYRLDRVLGVGGMATVYAATHRNTKQFAIKILHAELSMHESVRTRFQREGYLANQVKHPGAVTVLDNDVADDGSSFIVMELLDGASLDVIAAQYGPRVPLDLVLSIGDSLLDVLVAAHDCGIVHRDLKPANVFLATDGRLHVLDFGIARLHGSTGSATATGAMLGTPAYMAPEQALGNSREIDGRTDLWAVGATLFALLAGRLVHDGENGAQLLVNAATRHAPPLATVLGDIPTPIAAAIDRALVFDKTGRWTSAREMREALVRACVDVTGRPIATLTEAMRAARPQASDRPSPTALASSAASLGLASTIEAVDETPNPRGDDGNKPASAPAQPSVPMSNGNDLKTIKRVLLRNQGAEEFSLDVRSDASGVTIAAEGVPPSLEPELRQLLDVNTSAAVPADQLQDRWRHLLETFQKTGWTIHEVMAATIEMSMDDARVVSRITSPVAPNEVQLDIQRGIHRRIVAMFPDTARRYAAEIVSATSEGRHADAFATLKKAEEEGAFLGGPVREMVDAISSIDRKALPRADAFQLWGRRLTEKSRGRFYEDLEGDLQIMEGEFADEVAKIEGYGNAHLMIRAEIAEHTNRPEVAYARYRELAARTPLQASLRAQAHWGLFRLSAVDGTGAARHAELAGDAFVEAGDRMQAARCYASGADFCEAQDRDHALALLDKALNALAGDGARCAEYRANVLHMRARMKLEWRQLAEAFTDTEAAIAIRKTLIGVEDALLASLHLAKHIAEARGQGNDVSKLASEIEAVRPLAGSESRLRERLAKSMSEGIDVRRKLHEEVLQLDDPRLTAESLLTLGIASMKDSLADALQSLEAALELVQRTARLRRDLELHALIESTIGQSYFMHGDELRAIEWFMRAVAHDPRESTARQNVGSLLMKHNRYPELVDVLEEQRKVFGDLPGLLYFYGRALLGSARPVAAARALHRAREVCNDSDLMKHIDEWLGKAMKEPPELDATRGTSPAARHVTREEFSSLVASFAQFIANERRMSFWRTEEKKKKFISSPEQHGKELLHAFLRGHFGDGVTILEEVSAGAGILDLWIEIPGGMKIVVELKMCGGSYTARYAARGVDQLGHYMTSKKSHLGYLVVFDARRRDFGKGLASEMNVGASTVVVQFVDIRPVVVSDDEDDDIEQPGGS